MPLAQGAQQRHQNERDADHQEGQIEAAAAAHFPAQAAHFLEDVFLQQLLAGHLRGELAQVVGDAGQLFQPGRVFAAQQREQLAQAHVVVQPVAHQRPEAEFADGGLQAFQGVVRAGDAQAVLGVAAVGCQQPVQHGAQRAAHAHVHRPFVVAEQLHAVFVDQHIEHPHGAFAAQAHHGAVQRRQLLAAAFVAGERLVEQRFQGAVHQQPGQRRGGGHGYTKSFCIKALARSEV